MKKYKVLFCDLDGTLIETIMSDTFPRGIWDMKLRLLVFDRIKRLNPEWVCIVTNQGGIEKGYVSRQKFETKLTYVRDCIEDFCPGVRCCTAYCPRNDPENHRRKPNTGMLELFSAINDKYDKSEMLMIGDASGKPHQHSDTDKRTAENFGIDYMDVIDFELGKLEE